MIMRLPSKIRIEDGYHRLARRVRVCGSSKRVQPSPVGEAHGSKIRIAWLPGLMSGLPGKPRGSPPILAFHRTTRSGRNGSCIVSNPSRTIVPLLSSAPLAQKEFVRTSSGCTVLVSRFQSAPHAECPLICSGSSDARSNKTTRVGETTIASSATMPEVVFFRSKLQPRASVTEGAACARETSSGRKGRADHLMLQIESGKRDGGVGDQTEGRETLRGAFIAEMRDNI